MGKQKIAFHRSSRKRHSPISLFAISLSALFIWRWVPEMRHTTQDLESREVNLHSKRTQGWGLDYLTQNIPQSLVKWPEDNRLTQVGANAKTIQSLIAKPTITAVATDIKQNISKYIGNSRERCPPLSKKLFDDVSKQNTVMLAVSNDRQVDFLANWILNVIDAGITYYIVAASDVQTSIFLMTLRIPCFESDIIQLKETEGTLWGDSAWKRMTWEKVFVVERIVDWGFRLIISDLDVAWISDPCLVLPEKSEASIMFSNDIVWTHNIPNRSEKFELEGYGSAGLNVNTGLYVAYPSQNTTNFIKAWAASYPNSTDHDQNTAYTVLRQGNFTKEHPKNRAVKTAFNEQLWMGVIPAYIFASGHSYMVSELHKVLNVSKPIAMHATWVYGGLEGKKSRLREALMWHDPPEYYSAGQYLTIDLVVPKTPDGFNEWKTDEDIISFHLTALRQQLEQIYIGLAMAVALQRIFILPKIICFCDKSWYAMYRCRLDDADEMRLPFACPADYYFATERFFAPKLPGTRIAIREYSFLDNHRIPSEVKSSLVTLKPTKSIATESCIHAVKSNEAIQIQTLCGGLMGTASNATREVVEIPAGLSDKELVAVLEGLDVQARVLKVSLIGVDDIWEAYSGFECKGHAKEFNDRMQHIIPYEWCCRWPEAAEKLNKPASEKFNMPLNGHHFKRLVQNDGACTT